MRKICLIVLLSVLLSISGCSQKENSSQKGISVSSIVTGIGTVGQNTSDFENQSFTYTLTLTNNEEDSITVVSIAPILSEPFASKILDKNVTVKVNKTISKGSSIDVSGEIIFNAKGLTKEQVVGMKPFVKEVKVNEERTIQSSF